MLDSPPMIPLGPLLRSRYQIEGELGRGGMGVVYGGTDRQSGRRVAIKVVHRSPGAAGKSPRDRARQQERLLMEARTAAAVRHRHVVEVLDVGGDQDELYLVLERLDGHTLERVLRERGTIPPGEALRWLLPIMSALEALHRVGVVHRDVKPSNIFLSEEGGEITPKLLDFGLARGEGDPRVTSSGQVIGTPAYMAPEHAAGEAVGPTADVWSLGIVLYECIAGTTPFPPLDRRALAMQVLLGRVRPLSSACPSLPVSLTAAVDRALKRDLAQRYRSMGEMARALELACGESWVSDAVAEKASAAELARSALRGAPTEPQRLIDHVQRAATLRSSASPTSPVTPARARRPRLLLSLAALALLLAALALWLVPRVPAKQAQPRAAARPAEVAATPAPQVVELPRPQVDPPAQQLHTPAPAPRPLLKPRKRGSADTPAEPKPSRRSRSGVETEWL